MKKEKKQNNQSNLRQDDLKNQLEQKDFESKDDQCSIEKADVHDENPERKDFDEGEHQKYHGEGDENREHNISTDIPSFANLTITHPSFDGQRVPHQNLMITWTAVTGVSTYLLSLRNITTGALLEHHRTVGGTSFTITANRLTAGHEFRVAIGVQPPERPTVQWWEREFVVQGPAPTLNVTPLTWSPNSSAQTNTMSIITNQTLGNITSNTSWLTVEGSGTSRTMRVTANTSTASRSGTITVRAGNLTQAVNVTQAASTVPTLTLSRSTWSAQNTADSAQFTFTTNQPIGNVTVSSNMSWLSVTPTGTTRTMSVVANPGAQRAGTITVRVGNLEETISVTQAAAPTLTVSPTIWNPGSTQTSSDLTITTNQPIGNILVESNNPTWLTVSGTGRFRDMAVTANTGAAQRVGTITISGGGITRTITVTQMGANVVEFRYFSGGNISGAPPSPHSITTPGTIMLAHVNAGFSPFGDDGAMTTSESTPTPNMTLPDHEFLGWRRNNVTYPAGHTFNFQTATSGIHIFNADWVPRNLVSRLTFHSNGGFLPGDNPTRTQVVLGRAGQALGEPRMPMAPTGVNRIFRGWSTSQGTGSGHGLMFDHNTLVSNRDMEYWAVWEMPSWMISESHVVGDQTLQVRRFECAPEDLQIHLLSTTSGALDRQGTTASFFVNSGSRNGSRLMTALHSMNGQEVHPNGHNNFASAPITTAMSSMHLVNNGGQPIFNIRTNEISDLGDYSNFNWALGGITLLLDEEHTSDDSIANRYGVVLPGMGGFIPNLGFMRARTFIGYNPIRNVMTFGVVSTTIIDPDENDSGEILDDVSGVLHGATYFEMHTILKRLGCTIGMNIDGGGSARFRSGAITTAASNNATRDIVCQLTARGL